MSQEEKWAEIEARGPGLTWTSRGERNYKFRIPNVLKIWTRPVASYTCLLFVAEQGRAALVFPGNPATVRYYPDEATARVAMELLA